MRPSSTRPERPEPRPAASRALTAGRPRGFRRALLALTVAFALPALEAPPKAAAAKKAHRYRDAVLREVNRVRSRHALPRVRADRRLARTATAHSRHMARHRYLSHGAWTSRVRPASRHARSIGEVIGVLSIGTPRREARTIVRSWLHSPPHRAVLLDRHFRRIGIGRATARWSGRRTALHTADFASAR